jgi:NTE family protein
VKWTASHHRVVELIGLVFFSYCVFVTSFAETEPPKQTKIAIALSGGSALGLAHIGILKYFEEHHIPVDYVAGTSMGGLVGGFYASGLSAAEIETIVTQADWNDLISANPRFLDQPIVEKQYWNTPSGTLTLRFGRHFSLASGISSGESIALLFSRYTAAYGNLTTFNELPIPFRCVATDLVSADPVVLDHGSLPKALRATMALPGIFAPVEYDGRVLVDGGLVQNLPVETARGMGANFVIAVMLENKYAGTRQFRSLSGVLQRTISIPVIQNERRSAALANLVIRVQTGNLTGIDFEDSALLIQRGYEAAQAKAAELSRFALSLAEWKQYLAARRDRIRRLPNYGRLVAVESPQPKVQRSAEHELSRRFATKPIQPQQLEYELAGMTAATGLPGAYYDWRNQPGVPVGYRAEFLPRLSTLIALRPELIAEFSPDEPVRPALGLGATVIQSAAYKSRYLAYLNLGYDPGMRAEYFRPFEGSGYFVSPSVSVEQYNYNVYNGTARTDFQRLRAAASFRAGIGTGRFAQFSIGVLAGYDSYSRQVTTNGVTSESGPFANLESRWIYNTQDSGALPNKGTLLEGSLGYSFRRDPFPFLVNRFSFFQPFNGRTSLLLATNQESTFGINPSFYDQFTYGGLGQLEAYRYQQFHANTLVSGTGGILFHVGKTKLFSVDPRLIGLYEVARLDLGSEDWQTHQSISGGTLLATPLGTLGFTVGVDEQRKVRVRVSIGRF